MSKSRVRQRASGDAGRARRAGVDARAGRGAPARRPRGAAQRRRTHTSRYYSAVSRQVYTYKYFVFIHTENLQLLTNN